LYYKDSTRAPTILFIREGNYEVDERYLEWPSLHYLEIKYPMKIIGAGQEKTIIHGGFEIQGMKEEGKRVNMQRMTMRGSGAEGLYNDNGLSFLCKDMTFTQCGYGVFARNTKGRLINCVITQCEYSGILCEGNTLIELEGDQTKVDGNVTSGFGYNYGLKTFDTSSIIHLLFPLTKESVSTNNHGGRNYRTDRGTIETVNSFESS
jgi:hypothetical protein